MEGINQKKEDFDPNGDFCCEAGHVRVDYWTSLESLTGIWCRVRTYQFAKSDSPICKTGYSGFDRTENYEGT
jgi:hypothetical protein